MLKPLVVALCGVALVTLVADIAHAQAKPVEPGAPRISITELDTGLGWPTATSVSRPWTRWWWHGSAIDKKNISKLLETYAEAGLGGLEITPIYGVQGADDRELSYLSDQWIGALRYTLHEAERLEMQVDLATGSGWRTGGPSVTDEDANAAVVIEHEDIEGGHAFRREFPNGLPQALVAYDADGAVVDLLEASRKTRNSAVIEWQSPEGKWTLYTVTQKWSRDNVKRPAPGGEGKNINPLSKRSLGHFLDWFGGKLSGLPRGSIRAQFHDSYEYEGNWCDEFFAEFETRRGYRLHEHLPALDGEGDPADVARVKCDYRETVSDLVLENLIEPWTTWSHEHGMLARNQSHGSPANWLDLYAACDIPETESFGRLGGKDANPLVWRFASSAAHVSGKPLVSAESCTWLNEHFQETLGEMKECLDGLFLAGVNHVVYQGTAYSPQEAAWPGWLFYASTQVNPQNPIWRDLPALNEYVTRCQSVLQATKADNDILLYWPIHNFWTDAKGLRKDIRVHNTKQWFDNDFGRTAKWLDEQGYTFDYVSDRQLAECHVTNGKIQTAGGNYALVLMPDAKQLPLATAQKLVDLAEAGAAVVFHGTGHKEVPGWKGRQQQATFDDLAQRVRDNVRPRDSYHAAQMGGGQIIFADDLADPLGTLKVRRERWRASLGLKFHRRAWPGGHVYFIKNDSKEPFDEWLELSVDWRGAAILNPLDGMAAVAATRPGLEGGRRQIRLQLAPGETLFVKTVQDEVAGATWTYRQPAGEPIAVDGQWSVEFVGGGPVLPSSMTTKRLESWTTLASAEGERFAGTARYATKLSTDGDAERYLLDLGSVADSARAALDGKPLATLFAPPYQVELGDLPAGEHHLEVEVTNVAANRIRDLDRRGVKWRIFKDINLVNINYKPFDASDWPVRDAGLLGPVTLTPLGNK